MQLRKLTLTNFRNHEHITLDFNEGTNIIIGKNGAGKTNVLEGIYILSLTKSVRYNKQVDLIKFGKDFTKITGFVEKDNIEKEYKVIITKDKKRVFINNSFKKRLADYISNFCVISFSPDDLEIIKGSPQNRRDFLNVEISQLHNKYLNYLNQYNAILKIRNEYLKQLNINGNYDLDYLEIVNNKLVPLALKIYGYRYSFIEKINKNMPIIFKKLAGIPNLKIRYRNNIGIDEYNAESFKEAIFSKFRENLKKEIMQGMTLYGPHRDDFEFVLNNENIKFFSSQGQERLAIISMKLAELSIFKEVIGEYPVLLLDDIMSELDLEKKKNIFNYLNKSIQTIITTTDILNINEKIIASAKVFKIANGKITERGLKNGKRK